jgi:hypothetical protein
MRGALALLGRTLLMIVIEIPLSSFPLSNLRSQKGNRTMALAEVKWRSSATLPFSTVTVERANLTRLRTWLWLGSAADHNLLLKDNLVADLHDEREIFRV